MRIPSPLLAALIAAGLFQASCTCYRQAELAPTDAGLLAAGSGPVYLVEDSTRVWMVQLPLLDSAGLQGRFFRLEEPRAQVIRDVGHIEVKAWMQRLNGCKVYHTHRDPDLPALADGAMAHVPLAEIDRVTMLDIDRRKSRRHTWLGVGTFAAVVALIEVYLFSTVDWFVVPM